MSLLTDQSNGTARASYGYTPYGAADTTLSKGDTSVTTPFNPYQYSATRYDSGSQTYDMGVRRYDPSAERFLQLDQYQGALSDLSLAADPLTQNRYDLAASNPVTYSDPSGHYLLSQNGACDYYQPGCSAAYTHPSFSLKQFLAGGLNAAYSAGRSALSASTVTWGLPQVGQLAARQLPARLPLGNPSSPSYRLGGFAANAAPFLIPGGTEEDLARLALEAAPERLALGAGPSDPGSLATLGR